MPATFRMDQYDDGSAIGFVKVPSFFLMISHRTCCSGGPVSSGPDDSGPKATGASGPSAATEIKLV